MWSTSLLFFLMWMAFAYMWWIPLTHRDSSRIQAKAPTFRQTCWTNKVPCINDCSFLCVEKNARCVRGVCRVDDEEVDPLDCKTDKGGIVMMLDDLHWSCICTDSTFFGGRDCGTLNPDVCEKGVFLYNNRNNFQCLCLPPYELITIDNKPHCEKKAMTKFINVSLK